MNPFTKKLASARRRGPWLFVAAAALVAVLGRLHAGPSEPAEAATVQPQAAVPSPVPVTLATAQSRPLPLWLEAIGTVTSLNAVNVRPRVDGQLQAVKFKEGQPVKAGELLALLDPRPLQAQLAQAQAVLAQEEARLASSKVDLARAVALAQAGAGPTQAADTLHAQIATQAASVQAARAAVDSAQLQLGFTRITSPIDGRAGQKLVALGSTVHAADTTGIVTVTQMDPVWVAFSLPQEELPPILRESSRAHLKVEAKPRDVLAGAGLAAGPASAEGELVFIDSQVTPSNGQVQLKARFDNAAGRLWPGELVSVRLLLRTQPAAVVVPQQAVQQGPSGAFVYVADAGHVARVRTVSAGAVVDGMAWIRSGLAAGETVVAQGQYRVAAGVPVTEQAAAPAAAISGANP